MYQSDQHQHVAIAKDGHQRGGILGGSTAVAGPQQPQLSAVTERLSLVVGEMQGTVSELENRLACVLNPEFKGEAIGSGNGSVPRPARCSLGDTIDTLSDDLHNTVRRLRGLIERLAT